jgi:hypothetical protein
MPSSFPGFSNKIRSLRGFSFYIYYHLFSVTVHSFFSMLNSFPGFSYKIRLPKLFVLYLLSFIFCPSPLLLSNAEFFPKFSYKISLKISFSFYIYCHLFSVKVHSCFLMLSSFAKFSYNSRLPKLFVLYLLSFIFCQSPLLLFNAEFFPKFSYKFSLLRGFFVLYLPFR